MNHSFKTRAISLALAVLLVLGTVPMSALAADYDTGVSGEYFNVISKETYDLAPGATETEIVLNNDAGTDRKLVHVFEVDTASDSICVLPGYYQIDKLDPENLSDSTHWSAMELSKTVAYYEDVLGYNVVGAMNTALAYDSNAPYGYMVYEGVVLGTPQIHKGADTYLAINWDGTCELRSMSTGLTGNERTAIPANFGWLVKDGKLTTTSVERSSSDASRSMVGVKADGTLVFCQVDGRNAPTSTGLSNYEMGEMMLGLGCVNAFNCDGGGSSTFISKREGETENTMRSVPSDGSERPTINSVIIVNTAAPTGIFASAVLDSEFDYIAPGASMDITAAGVDTNGYAMDVPYEEVTWQMADAAMGTITAGVFTAGAYGDAVIQMVFDGNVVGEKTVHVVDPDVFEFNVDATVLPYGKSMDILFNCTYGLDSWQVCVEGACELSLDDENAAWIDGDTLTATDDESVAGVTLTARYLPVEGVTAVMAIEFGKGSEILFDFEDGDISDWMGFVDAKQWSVDNGVKNTLVGSSPLSGQFNDQISSTTFLASEENGGQVKHGDYALAWSLDNTDADFANWSYNVLFYVGEQLVLRDTANGQNATKLGMWLYIPENAAGLAFQSQLYNSTKGCIQSHFTFITADGTVKNLNSCTEADIPDSRWVYASIDLTAQSYLTMPDAYDTISSRSPSVIRTYVKPVEPAVITFYIDDITLDYSSAVDDRVQPTISNVCYSTGDTALDLTDGAVFSGSTAAFSATVADNIALDQATGAILIDGMAVETNVSGGRLSCGNVELLPGVHTVAFEIRDTMGNLARQERTFTVSGESVVTLDGHNDTGLAPEYDSIYWIDLNVAEIADIDSLEATVYLQTANTWEPAGITVADGFEVGYELCETSNEITLQVKKNGEPVLTGAQTLVSIPVRLWSWNGVNNVTGVPIAPADHFKTGYCPVVQIRCTVREGRVSFLEERSALGAFGGNLTVDTKMNDNVNPWHTHDAELTVLEQAPTCADDGFAGRTYCAGCGSVIDWGTVVPATGHIYEVRGTGLYCACGDRLTGSGIVSANGKLYYLIADNLVSGWQAQGTGWCYADPATYQVATGTFTVSGLTYTADETGVLVRGAWDADDNGVKYSYGPGYYTRTWADIDGARYYFGTDRYVYTGVRFIPVNRNNIKEGYRVYTFGTDGRLLDEMLDASGIITSEVDGMFYVENGTSVYGGLMLIDGDYYYARTSGQLVVNATYWITKTNDLLPAAGYTFGADGRMIDPPATEEPDPEEPEIPQVKNGIISEDGKLWWYVDGVKTYAGLMLIDGDYYYARSSGQILTDTTYWITKTNDLLPAASYTFGPDGRMIDPPATEEPDPEEPEIPQVKNGIVSEDGKLWWYVDGVKTYAGLMLIDGDYYYARSSGQILTDTTYWITKTNDLLPAAYYTFGADGKMIDPPTA